MASSVQQSNKVNSCSGCCRGFVKMSWRLFKCLPVLLIMSIIMWSYYAYVVQLCINSVENIAQRCVYLVVYHILFVMLMWSYGQTIFSNTRQIPNKFKLPDTEVQKLLSADSEEAQRDILENFASNLPIVTRTMSGAIRYCNRCILVKPDRAHHCSICARCVLKMDHHCPWVNNCVCFHNYKFFLLFLGYALAYCLFLMLTTLPQFIKFWKMNLAFRLAQCDYDKPSLSDLCIEMLNGEFGTAAVAGRYHVVFAFFVSLMFGISLGSLFCYHCFLVASNRTTLEAFRAPMFRGGADKKGFSIGCYSNLKEVFGPRPALWPVPIFTSVGDGCEYPVRREHRLEPPPEPHGYESMGSTRPSVGDGIVYPVPVEDEDMAGLLSSERWDRWGQRTRPPAEGGLTFDVDDDSDKEDWPV